ncbi:hypothetical protein [Amycolatopsis ultiminotia]|uniref:hypothetical protein n=1 Tax=Amycolatopsis ultiminotia TaxID=543629 RepID=UPI003CD05A07
MHGILIQHPVPGRFDYDAALSLVDPDKDADGQSRTVLPWSHRRRTARECCEVILDERSRSA